MRIEYAAVDVQIIVSEVPDESQTDEFVEASEATLDNLVAALPSSPSALA